MYRIKHITSNMKAKHEELDNLISMIDSTVDGNNIKDDDQTETTTTSKSEEDGVYKSFNVVFDNHGNKTVVAVDRNKIKYDDETATTMTSKHDSPQEKTMKNSTRLTVPSEQDCGNQEWRKPGIAYRAQALCNDKGNDFSSVGDSCELSVYFTDDETATTMASKHDSPQEKTMKNSIRLIVPSEQDCNRLLGDDDDILLRGNQEWRKPGIAYRAQALCNDKGNDFSSVEDSCELSVYFTVTEKYLDDFLKTKIDSFENAIDAYLIGTRLFQFLTDSLPTHKDYHRLTIIQENKNASDTEEESRELLALFERTENRVLDLLKFLDKVALYIDRKLEEGTTTKINNNTKTTSLSSHIEAQHQKGLYNTRITRNMGYAALFDDTTTMNETNSSPLNGNTLSSFPTAASKATFRSHDSDDQPEISKGKYYQLTMAQPGESSESACSPPPSSSLGIKKLNLLTSTLEAAALDDPIVVVKLTHADQEQDSVTNQQQKGAAAAIVREDENGGIETLLTDPVRVMGEHQKNHPSRAAIVREDENGGIEAMLTDPALVIGRNDKDHPSRAPSFPCNKEALKLPSQDTAMPIASSLLPLSQKLIDCPCIFRQTSLPSHASSTALCFIHNNTRYYYEQEKKQPVESGTRTEQQLQNENSSDRRRDEMTAKSSKQVEFKEEVFGTPKVHNSDELLMPSSSGNVYSTFTDFQESSPFSNSNIGTKTSSAEIEEEEACLLHDCAGNDVPSKKEETSPFLSSLQSCHKRKGSKNRSGLWGKASLTGYKKVTPTTLPAAVSTLKCSYNIDNSEGSNDDEFGIEPTPVVSTLAEF